MKRYYAKWIPVPGEIGECDDFLYNGNAYCAHDIEQHGDEWYAEDWNHDRVFRLSDCEKAVLYIVDRENGDSIVRTTEFLDTVSGGDEWESIPAEWPGDLY